MSAYKRESSTTAGQRKTRKSRKARPARAVPRKNRVCFRTISSIKGLARCESYRVLGDPDGRKLHLTNQCIHPAFLRIDRVPAAAYDENHLQCLNQSFMTRDAPAGSGCAGCST